MDAPVRCPTCNAEFDARRLWAEDVATCRYCGAELAIPDVLADWIDEHAGGDDEARQIEAFRASSEPRDEIIDDPTDEQALERALAEALDLFTRVDDDGEVRAGEALTDEIRDLLRELGVAEPAPDAPREAIERALAEARVALVRLDREGSPGPDVEALVSAVGEIDPQALVDEEATDPSLYLDEILPHPDDKSGG